MNIPTDKVLHLMAGAVAAGLALPFGIGASLLAAPAAGVGKELYDQFANWRTPGNPPHSVEWQDAAYTAGGGVCFAIASLALQAIAGLA